MKLEESSIDNILENLLKRSPNQYDTYQDTVAEILNDVKENGDKALFAYTEKFDKAVITKDTIKVTEEEIKEAYDQVDDSLIEVMKKSLANIRDFHEKQLRNSWFETREDGVILGQRVTALESVGVYVPGGKAAYPSSVLMNIIPAKVAGVKRIVMTTPPGKDGKVNPGTLVAANEAGVDVIYKVGGAQAIAALAFGTESIPKVDKIVGPTISAAPSACTAVRIAIIVVGIRVMDPVEIAITIHCASVAMFSVLFSVCNSCIALIPRGVHAFPRPRTLAAMYMAMAEFAG